MEPILDIPARLYKYRKFGDQLLNMLIADVIYFADPRTFNDPLDSKPTFHADLDVDDLKTVLMRLTEQRLTDEMSAAAQFLKLRGLNAAGRIAKLSRAHIEGLLADISYNATDPDYDFDNPEQLLLGQAIKEELLRRYNKGIFSLAEQVDCPLMWSHYGDQHHGICLGYSVPSDVRHNIHQIKYGGSRLVMASSVASMLNNHDEARREVDEAVLLRKAEPWAYEREWRLIDSQGEQPCRLELEEVVFGLRCPTAVRFAVLKALEGRTREVEFHEIREQHDRFTLVKSPMETDEMCAYYPRRHRGALEAFETIDMTSFDTE